MTTNTTYKRGDKVTLNTGQVARITGETTTGKKTGKLFYAAEVARMIVPPYGKKMKIVGWNRAEWIREDRIK